MFYLCFLYLFTHTCVQDDLHIILCSCRLTVTRRVSLVEQELLTLPSTYVDLWFLMGFVLLNLLLHV